MPIVRAEDLTYTRVRALDMARTLCFQPVSALEVHGPHLGRGSSKRLGGRLPFGVR